MKYVITSKNVFEGTSTNDVPNPIAVTEIATELVITRLYAIDLLSTGVLSKEDTVVCIEDRKCLYENIFDNVISFDEFTKSYDGNGSVLDLLNENLFNSLAAGPIESRLIPYKPFYQNWERDKNEILNVKYSSMEEYDTSKPYVALVVRKRGAWKEKNMSDSFWNELLDRLAEKNINTFVFGKETETFCKEGTTIKHVKNFQDWCGIVHHQNCKVISSTMTGALHAALVFGHSESKMVIIDNLNLMSIHGEDPSFYNSCINFSKIDLQFITKIPSVEELYETISANL